MPLRKIVHRAKKWVTHRKSCHTFGNGITVRKTSRTWKNGTGTHSEKWVALQWKNGSHLEKWVTLWEMGPTYRNGSHLENWVSLKRQDPNWENRSNLENWVTFKKNANWKKYSTLKNFMHKIGHTLNTVSHLQKWVTLRKIEKMITVCKMGHTW